MVQPTFRLNIEDLISCTQLRLKTDREMGIQVGKGFPMGN